MNMYYKENPTLRAATNPPKYPRLKNEEEKVKKARKARAFQATS